LIPVLNNIVGENKGTVLLRYHTIQCEGRTENTAARETKLGVLNNGNYFSSFSVFLFFFSKKLNNMFIC
jgi:hypothetical protein